MKEQWKDVVGYEGYYQVSNLGNFRSVTREVGARSGKTRIIKGRTIYPKLNKVNGRMQLPLWKNNRGLNHYPHTLVLLAFIGPKPKGTEACHFPDKDITNNRLDNLRWDTSAANKEDMLKHGSRLFGSKVATAKLKESDVIRIIRQLENGVYPSKISKIRKVAIQTINDIRANRTWKHIPRKLKPLEYPNCRKGGCGSPVAKFSQSQVNSIRYDRLVKRMTWPAMSAKYKAARQVLWRIVTKRSYA